MEPTTRTFDANARKALSDGQLQSSLKRLRENFPAKRQAVADRLAEFDALCDEARRIKAHALEHLDYYLERFEARVKEHGGHVHWCADAAEARNVILDICRQAGAGTVTKSKSMIGEEIAINDHLEASGLRPVETDLGEYIIQLRREAPSHIIMPAIHLTKEQIAAAFVGHHQDFDPGRSLAEPREILEEARAVLRREFLSADVGLTGANMLVAETGSIVVVTNEGNADLTMSLPRVHIAIASIEKAVPTLEDAATILRVLARSATGQELSVYTTFATGPKRQGDPDGPEEFHVVLLDNGRSRLLGTEFQELLRCIRCGACLNHCPVYGAIGGHAYGWVYPGPLGAALNPALLGIGETASLPDASTLCGKCESVCPVRIRLPKLLRHWREVAFRRGIAGGRFAIRAWAWLAKRPRLYHFLLGFAVWVLAAAGRKGRFRRLPLAGNWTAARDLPAPQGGTFISLWRRKKNAAQGGQS